MNRDGGLDSLITCDLLLQMARDLTYARGLAYAREGRVRDVSVLDGVLTAWVEGGKPYRVRLFRQGTRLEFDCTCPVGGELRFCKHGVAAGLAWLLAQGEPVGEGGAPGAAPEERMERIRIYLTGLDAPALRELLLSEARGDGALCDRLLLRDAGDATAFHGAVERRGSAGG